MERHFWFLVVAIGTFGLGLSGYCVFQLSASLPNLPELTIEPPVVLRINESIADIEIGDTNEPETDTSVLNPLEKVWVSDDIDRAVRGNLSIIRKCGENEYRWTTCRLTLRYKERLIRSFDKEHGNNWWLKFGFFDFLGDGDEQLIVHTYSGGAHCCYDFYIYDLKPVLRLVYDSSKYDSGDEIGSDLFPIDIDSDGVYEFTRRVETFCYFHASYADSNKPTAIFAFDRWKGAYDLANHRFPDYILADTQRTADWFRRENIEYDEKFMARETFLNLVYSGNEMKAWEYFDKNYNFDGKDDYRREVKELFRTDPTYLSIYKKWRK